MKRLGSDMQETGDCRKSGGLVEQISVCQTRKLWLVPVVLFGLFVLVIVLIILRAILAEPPALPVFDPKPVEVVTVRKQPYDEVLVLPSRLQAQRASMLSFDYGGRIEAWLVADGARVRVGDVLARLNTDELVARRNGSTAMIDDARAGEAVAREGLASAESALVLADKEFSRTAALLAERVVSQSMHDQSTHARNQARAAVEARRAELAARISQVREAESQLEVVTIMLDRAQLRAPFSGWLDRRLVEIGAFAGAGEPVIRLYDLSSLRVQVDVADRYAPLLDTNNPSVAMYIQAALPGAEQSVEAEIMLPGLPKLTGGTYEGLRLPATILRVAQAADAASNTFRVELGLKNPGDALKEGMIVEARIRFLRYPNALVIPLRSVMVTDEGPRVAVVRQQHDRAVISIHAVEPISIRQESVLIRSGLAEGDRLVVSGGKGVIDGEAVRVLILDGVHQTAVQEPRREQP